MSKKTRKQKKKIIKISIIKTEMVFFAYFYLNIVLEMLFFQYLLLIFTIFKFKVDFFIMCHTANVDGHNLVPPLGYATCYQIRFLKIIFIFDVLA